MKRFLLFVVVAIGVGTLYAIFGYTSRDGQSVSETVSRALYGKDLHLPPDAFAAESQHQVVEEYRRRGYKLHCYGDLRPEERIHPADDYICYAPLKSSMDNVDTTSITMTFTEGRMTAVRLELPEESFEAMQGYLAKRLASNPRVDKLPWINLGTDAFGKPLMAWLVQGGMLITALQPTKGKTVILLWESRERFMCRGAKRRSDSVCGPVEKAI